MSTVVINNISALDGQDILGDGSNATTIEGIPIDNTAPTDDAILVYHASTKSYGPENIISDLDLLRNYDANNTYVYP